MKNIAKILAIAIVGFVFAANTALAQDFTSVNDAFKLMNKKGTVIVFCGKTADYAKTHITKSVNVYHGSLNNAEPIKSVLKSSADVAAILGKAGISNTATIILYDKGSSKYSGRMYWILKYMGATNVTVLNGGLKAWRAGRKPITKTPTKRKATTFTTSVNKKYFANFAQTKAALTGGVVLDVRSAAEFKGEADSKSIGHITGAKNLEFKQVLDAKGLIKSKDELVALFKTVGITADTNVVLYCQTSVRAGIVFAALHSVLAYTNVKVYDGALNEWEAKSASISK